MPSVSPAWSETSVRWLRENGHHYWGGSEESFSAILVRTLLRIKYHHYEMVDNRSFSASSYQNHLTSTVDNWNHSQHKAMVKFLAEGGYDALVKKMESAVPEKVRIPVTDGAGKVIGTESIELEMDELENAVERTEFHKSQQSPNHELEEIVAEAALASDPRFGVW